MEASICMTLRQRLCDFLSDTPACVHPSPAVRVHPHPVAHCHRASVIDSIAAGSCMTQQPTNNLQQPSSTCNSPQQPPTTSNNL
mmetsp:Transcript_3457/g.6484  ORF Transcript_3457/g.6484 Transcript_3457/m.6484 type:complete len:84 (-) Transcript_3457:1163-1414(-)